MKRTRLILGCTTLSIILVAAMSAAAFFLIRIPPVNDQLPESSSALLARIQSPFDQSEVGLVLPTKIHATSFGSDAVTTLQLWVNGSPVDAKTNSTPSKQFDADFAWQPYANGDYSLVVRAIDQNGRIATSSAVRVRALTRSVVVDLTVSATISDTLESLAEEFAVPLDHLLLLNPKIDPKQPLKADQEIDISIGLPTADIAQPPVVPPPLPASPVPPSGNPKLILPALPNAALFALGDLFGTPKAPIAPEVAASVAGCKTNIFISDQAKDETGFFLYQLKGNENAFKRIAVFDANNDSSPLKYVIESSPLGSTQYYVAAFNGGGESPSDIVIAHISDVKCAASESPKSKFKEPTLILNEQVEELYCYTSLNDLPWKRLPSAPNQFLSSSNTKFDLSQYMGEFTSPQADVTLEMECWGWKGGTLKSLGKGIQIIKAKQTGAFTLKGAGFTFNGTIAPAPVFIPLLVTVDTPLLTLSMGNAPDQIIPAPYGVKAESDPSNNQLGIMWNWNQVGCFPQGAGETPKPCPYVNDIEGYKVYNTDGLLVKTFADPKTLATIVGASAGKCFVVTAFKGSLESAKSQAGCIDTPPPQFETTTGIAPPVNLRVTTNPQECKATGNILIGLLCEAALKNNIQVLLWDWVNQPASDIDGFRLYDAVNGQLFAIESKSNPKLRVFMVPPLTGVLLSDYCFSVRAFKGDMESVTSNTVCLKPLLPPIPPTLILEPMGGKLRVGIELHKNYNSGCPLPEKHYVIGGKNQFDGGFSVANIHSADSGILCDKMVAIWNEGGVKFSLNDVPTDFTKATLKFKSSGSLARTGKEKGLFGSHGEITFNVSCTKAIYAYHIAPTNPIQDPSILYIGDPYDFFTYFTEDIVTTATANTLDAENAIDITALVKKNLKAGKKTLGFVFLTNEALQMDNDVCASGFKSFSLEVEPKK